MITPSLKESQYQLGKVTYNSFAVYKLLIFDFWNMYCIFFFLARKVQCEVLKSFSKSQKLRFF